MVSALQSLSATPNTVAPQRTTRAAYFGHDTKAEDKADLSTKKAAIEVKEPSYKLIHYLWHPGSGAGNVVKNLVYPTRTIISDLIWAMALPPFTFVIPAYGIFKAIRKANKAKKDDAAATESIPASKPPTTTPDPVTTKPIDAEPAAKPISDTDKADSANTDSKKDDDTHAS